MSGPARWVVCPLTHEAHLLRPDGAEARCGVSVPADAPVQDRQRRCPSCVVIFRADLDYPLRRDPQQQAVRIRWGLSIEDWRSHAIDERGDHPVGVYRAQCGCVVLMVTGLHDEPRGTPCQACATLQLNVVQTALDRAAAALRLTQSDDPQPPRQRHDE